MKNLLLLLLLMSVSSLALADGVCVHTQGGMLGSYSLPEECAAQSTRSTCENHAIPAGFDGSQLIGAGCVWSEDVVYPNPTNPSDPTEQPDFPRPLPGPRPEIPGDTGDQDTGPYNPDAACVPTGAGWSEVRGDSDAILRDTCAVAGNKSACEAITIPMHWPPHDPVSGICKWRENPYQTKLYKSW